MPMKHELREGEGLNLDGPFAISIARGGRAIIYAANYDDVGLLESLEDCKVKAARHRTRYELDKQNQKDKD